MRYWLVTFDEKDYRISSANGFDILGLPEQSRWEKMLKQVQEGDKIIAYASGISHFGAVLEVTREYFYEKTKIWDRDDELWPHRIGTRLLYELPVDKKINAKAVIMGMETPSDNQKNEMHWALFLRGSMRGITQRDYKWIVSQMAKADDLDPNKIIEQESEEFIEPSDKEEIEFTQKLELPRTAEEAESELAKISQKISKEPVKEKIKIAKILSRNKLYSKLVKERVNYVCEVCGEKPFTQKNGQPYAEAHHKFELAKSRIDNPEDMICVCPTCHRVIHYGSDEELKKRSRI
ncbi:MAG: EVE domain-containing protein [Minisyncoccia bacterium]